MQVYSSKNNLSLNEVDCSDGSKIKSARYTDYDFQARKKLKVLQKSDLIGDCHIYSDLIVDGSITSSSLDLSSAGQTYINNIAQKIYHLLGWDDANQIFEYSLLGYDDSVDERILELKNNTYTKVEMDVIVNNATSSAISYFSESMYVSPISGVVVATPCSVIPLGNTLVIPYSNTPSSKTQFFFQCNTPVVGQVLTCISAEGKTEWRNPSTSTSFVSTITTSNGVSSEPSFSVNDSITSQGMEYLPNTFRGTKSAIVADNDSVLCNHFVSSSENGMSITLEDANRQVGIRLQKFDEDSQQSILELFGGKPVSRDSFNKLNAQQIIRMDNNGIHLSSNQETIVMGALKIKEKESNYYNSNTTVVPASLQIGISNKLGSLLCYGNTSLIGNLLLPQGAASGKIWSCIDSSGVGQWVSPSETSVALPTSFSEKVIFYEGFTCENSSTSLSTFNNPVNVNNHFRFKQDFLRVQTNDPTKYTSFRDVGEGISFDIYKQKENEEVGFYFQNEGQTIMSVYQNMLTVNAISIGNIEKTIQSNNLPVSFPYMSYVSTFVNLENPSSAWPWTTGGNIAYNYYQASYTVPLSPTVSTINYHQQYPFRIDFSVPIRWAICYAYETYVVSGGGAGVGNNINTLFNYTSPSATISIMNSINPDVAVKSFTVTRTPDMREFSQNRHILHTADPVGLKFIHHFSDEPVVFSIFPEKDLPSYGTYYIKISMNLVVGSKGVRWRFSNWIRGDIRNPSFVFDINDDQLNQASASNPNYLFSGITCILARNPCYPTVSWTNTYGGYPSGDDVSSIYPIIFNQPTYSYPLPTLIIWKRTYHADSSSLPPEKPENTLVKNLITNNIYCYGAIQAKGTGVRAGSGSGKLDYLPHLFNAYWTDASQRLLLYIDDQVITTIKPNSTVCDYRLKENTRNARDVLERILNIPMIEYSVKNSEKTRSDGNRMGFFAHLLQESFPEFPNIVFNQKDDPANFQSINSPDLIILLMKAIQEIEKNRKKEMRKMYFLLFMFHFLFLFFVVIFLREQIFHRSFCGFGFWHN